MKCFKKALSGIVFSRFCEARSYLRKSQAIICDSNSCGQRQLKTSSWVLVRIVGRMIAKNAKNLPLLLRTNT